MEHVFPLKTSKMKEPRKAHKWYDKLLLLLLFYEYSDIFIAKDID